MSEQEIEREAERLHKIGAATVQRMREEHGMTHKFPTGADAYEDVLYTRVASPEQIRACYQETANQTAGVYDRYTGCLQYSDRMIIMEQDTQCDTYHWYDLKTDRNSPSFELDNPQSGMAAIRVLQWTEEKRDEQISE